jgi:hypothetical protein
MADSRVATEEIIAESELHPPSMKTRFSKCSTKGAAAKR